MSRSQFYLTLPSNTEAGCPAPPLHVRLPNRIKLEGDWEVGLAEIIYPFSWYNFQTEHCKITAGISNSNMDWSRCVGGYIPSSFYEDVTQVIDAINKLIKNQVRKYQDIPDDAITFTFNDGYVILLLRYAYVDVVALHPNVSKLLGFLTPTLYLRTVQRYEDDLVIIRADNRAVDIKTEFQTLYIYCNIIEDQIVGNTLAPLLRIIDVQGRFKNIIHRTFDNPHYMPILQKDITNLEINIKTDANEFGNFEFGKVVVKLHFRKRFNFD